MKIQHAPVPSPLVRKRPVTSFSDAKEPVAPEPQEPAAPPPPPPNTREVRIGRFVQTLTRASLQHLRYLSTIMAFNMVGTTAGLIGFTPLAIKLAHENAAVVGGVAIGGGVLTGSLAALAGYALEKKTGGAQLDQSTHPSKFVDTGLTLAAGVQALPKFIYPTVYGATPQERQAIYDALDKLPLKDVTASQTMHVIDGLTDTGISGMSQPGLTHTRILLDKGYIDNPARAEGLVHHEQGHAVDYSGGYGLLGPLNWRGPFGHAPHVSDYARGNRYEDFAETFEQYHGPNPPGPEFDRKVSVIEAHERKGPLEALTDRESVRSAGRNIGEAFSSIPYLRTAVETGMALLSPIQLHRGSRYLEQGILSGDERLKLQGKMNLISGVLLGLPGGAPFAMAASGLHLGMQMTHNNDAQKLKDANQTADKFMAVATGPLGMAAVAARQELQKAGIDLANATSVPEQYEDKVSGGGMLKGLLFTVGGAVAGSLLGAAVGGALSGTAGATLSSFWGRIGGGLVGLGVYGAMRAQKEEQNDPSPYDLTRGDKVFLGKIVGGAAAGAALGTVAGVWGGRALAGALGEALIGPGASSWTASIGGWTGALVGSYAIGKAGAVVGRKWTEGDAKEV